MDVSSIHLLLVEDDAEYYLRVRTLLERMRRHCSVEWADSYQAAVDALTLKKFDVVLVDDRLGEMTGIDVIAAAAAAGTGAPAIMLLSDGDPESDPDVIAAGAADYLHKDRLDLRSLERTIDHVLDRQRLTDALRQSDERLRAVISSARVSLLATDQNGFITLYEGMGVDLFSGDSATVPGRHVNELAADHPRTVVNIRHALLGETFTDVLEIDGETVECRYSPATDSSGRCTGMVCVTTNITERQRSEDALRKREQHFRHLIENALDIIAVLDRDGNVRYGSPAVERVLGFSLSDLIGRTVFDLIHPSDLEDTITSFQEVLADAGVTRSRVVRCLHKDGSWRYLEAIGTNLLHDPTLRGVVVNARDITERRMIEQERSAALKALVESEENYRVLAETASDGIITIDGDGTIRFVNNAAGHIFGYLPSEMLGENITILVPDYLKEIHRRALASFIETGIRHLSWDAIELPAVHRNGVSLPVEMSIAHYYRDGRHLFTGIVRDITERKRLEREQVRLLNMVEHERQRLDSLIKSIPGVVWEIYLDPKRADSNFVSPYVETIYGVTPEEWFADPLRWRELIHPNDLETVLAVPLLAAPAEGINFTHRILTGDGRMRWLDVRLVVIRDEAGKPEMLRGITLDVTDRRNAEEALRLSEERFRITLDNSPIAVFTQDRDLRYTWIQNAGPRYRAGEVLGRTEEELFDPHCAEELIRIKRSVLERGVGMREEVKISARGIISYIDLAVEPYRDADGGIIGVTCMAIDITERKQTADELLLFRTLIDKSNDAIFVIDPLGASILDVNETACTDLGYSRRELLALTIRDISTLVTDDGHWQEPFRMARELGFVVIESVCRRKNRDTFPVELSLTWVTVDQRDYMVAVARDVTERMRAQEAIRRSQEFFQSFMDNIPALAFMKDTEGRYVYCNRHLAGMLGLEVDQVIGRTDLELWPERKGRQFRESDSIVRSLARPLSFTERLDMGSNESYSYVVKFPMLDTVGKSMVAGISIDVTERVRAERRLEESQRLNQAILHSLSAHIAVLDRNGTIVAVNHAWERYPVENGGNSPISASIGTNYLDVCRHGITSEVEGSRQALDGIQQILRGDANEFTMEYPSHTPRHKQWFLFSATSLQGLGGAVVSHMDITERKLAEIALRESQMRFLAFANNSPVIFYIKDRKGRYILGNDLFGALVGRPAQDLIGKTDFELWPPEIASVFAETDRMVLETGAPIEREETIRTDGATRSWVTIKFPVPDESGNPLIGGAAVEITERVYAEQSLRTSEERFQLVMRATNDAIWDWDLPTGSVWWNQNVETLFRYHPDEVTGDISFWYDRLHPEDRERVHEHLQSAIDGRQQLWTDEYRFLRGDGTYAYVFDRGHLLYDPDGRVTRMIGAMVDITERKNAEEAVRDSEEKYRRIVEAAREGIVVTDAKGLITFTNARMAQITGYPVEELVGRPYADLMEEEWRDAARQRANRRREGIAEQYDFRFIRKDGTLVWAIVSANPVFDKHGAIIGSLGMVTDITDRKRAEEALREAHDKLELRVQERTAEIVAMMAQLEEAHRMQKRFVADASHDLRTPLTVIRAELDLLLNHGNLLPDTRRSLHRVASEARRLNSLADDLLLLAILDAKDRLSPHQPVRLDELLLESISNLSTLAQGKEIAWNIEIEEPIELVCDPAALDRAVTNVLENAIKYSPDASVIGVKLSKRDDEAEIEVVDAGIGIPPQDISKVFDRFYRSDLTRSTQGTGLGLSIVKAVMDAHDGQVMVESRPNEGTMVRLSIPGVEN